MLRQRRLRAGLDEGSEPDITPLLDVVFILLLFFVIAAAFTVRGMDLNLPPAKSAHSIAGRIIELTLNKDGVLYNDGVEIGENGLLALLAGLEHSGVEGGNNLVLKADAKAPAGSLLRVMDIIRTQGGGKLILATAPLKRTD